VEEEEYELRSTYGPSFTVIDAASARKGGNNQSQHKELQIEQDKEKEKGKEKEGAEIKKASRRQLGRSRSLSPKRRQPTPESTPEKSSQDTKSGKAKRRKRRSKKKTSPATATFASLCAAKFPHLKTWAITLEPSEGLGRLSRSLIFHI